MWGYDGRDLPVKYSDRSVATLDDARKLKQHCKAGGFKAVYIVDGRGEVIEADPI